MSGRTYGRQYVRPIRARDYPQIDTEEPVARTCPHCLEDVITNPEKRTGQKQRNYADFFLLCGWLCCLCWLCCYFLCCKDEWNDTYHCCPSCKLVIGVHMYHDEEEDEEEEEEEEEDR